MVFKEQAMIFVRNFLSSTIFFYALCALLIWCFLDYSKLKNNAVAQTMSRFVPAIHYFGDFVEKTDHFDQFKLRQCIAYHKRVVSFFSYQASEAHQMLGFCYDRLGDQSKSRASYEAAIKSNPEYIWPYYNLGFYAYKKGEYRKAVDYFKETLQKDIKLNAMMLMRSKVFTDVRLSDRPDYNIFESLLQTRQKSYVLMMESLSKLEAYQELLNIALVALKEENSGLEDVYLYYAGKAAFHEKSYERAIQLLQMALQKNSQNPEVLFYLSQYMRMAGKEDVAINFAAMAKEAYQAEGSSIEKYLNSRVKFF